MTVEEVSKYQQIFMKNNIFQLSRGIKTFIEAISIYNIHTGKKVFRRCYFWRFVSRFDSDSVKKLEVYFESEWVFFAFIGTAQKGSFPLRISEVNVTKSAGNWRKSHLLKKSIMENFNFCAVREETTN